jgi:hypothetical protein
MKNLRTAVLCAVLAFGTCGVKAQNVPINEPDYNKPKLFNNLPDRIVFGTERINTLLATPVGSPVLIRLTETPVAGEFRGEVISVTSKYDNQIQTVVIRSTNFTGAVLTLSKVTDTDGNVSYTGRIVSMHNGDLFELKSMGTDYVLAKKNFNDLINE